MMNYNENNVLEMDTLEFAKWIEKKFLEGLNKAQICNYFWKLQDTVQNINNMMMEDSIAKRTGEISRNPQLHGFLFEKLHVYMFNVRATWLHKDFRAYELPVDGGAYGKNSVDIGIYRIDKNGQKIGNALRKYQGKCCQNADATITAIKSGDYRNQRLLVPENQIEKVKEGCSAQKTVTDCIEYDGVKSTPLRYEKLKEMQNAMQSGDFNNVDLSMFRNQELIVMGVLGVGKQVAVDVLFRGIGTVVNHIILKSTDSLENDLKDNGKELLWDAAKHSVAEILQMEIGKQSKLLPEVLKDVPSDQIKPVSYIISEVLIDGIRIGYGYKTGEYSEVEAYAEAMKVIIKAACTLGGTIAAGAFTEGTAAPIGSVIGGITGDIIIKLIGEENLKVAANGCLELKEKAKEQIVSIENNMEKLTQKSMILEEC